MAFKKTGQWQKTLIPDDVDESFRNTQARTLVLLVRVRDAEVRNFAQNLKAHCNDVVRSQDRATSNRAAEQMLAVYSELNQRIGVVLRELEDAETAVS